MASSDMHPSVRKTQSELWLSRNGNFRKSARSFAFSTAAHILILSIFATTAVAIMLQPPELIKVKAPPVSDQEREEMLSVELPVNRASTPPGPPGPMQDTQKAGLSYLPGTPTETIEIRPLPDFDDLSVRVEQVVGYDVGKVSIVRGEAPACRYFPGLDIALVIDSARSRVIRLISLINTRSSSSLAYWYCRLSRQWRGICYEVGRLEPLHHKDCRLSQEPECRWGWRLV